MGKAMKGIIQVVNVSGTLKAMLTQAEEKGSVNVFGIELGANAFQGLKDILASKFSKK